ncbi:MAG: hypothetical protein HY077_10130 [Elusimicrobia bacterium]|nr:hypothetical protein [Elusimicrobiota bacterium]
MNDKISAGLVSALLEGRRVVVAAAAPEKGMRTLSILCAFTLICQPRAWGEGDPIIDEPDEAASMPGAVQPAYRFIEGISDGVYDFARRRVAGTLLPERLTRSLKAAPKKDSAPLFERHLQENESRYLARARAAYPLAGGEAQVRSWRSWAAAEQASVAADTLADTLVERYQLEFFGDSSGRYALDRRNWNPGFLSMSGVLGGTFLYLAGVHASASVGRLKLGIDLSPGLRFQRALQGAGEAQRLASLELGLKDVPLTLTTEWGLSEGRLRGERVALNYRLRY